MSQNALKGRPQLSSSNTAPREAAAAAAEEDSGHSPPSSLDRMYSPLPAKVIWMLQHESRCRLAAVDHLRCTRACESGALRRACSIHESTGRRTASDGGHHSYNEFAEYFGADAGWYWDQAPLIVCDIQRSLQQIDWFKQHGLENSELKFAKGFDEPVNLMPASITHIAFGVWFNQPVDQLPLSVTHIEFGEKFDQPVEQLPSSVTHLTLGALQAMKCYLG